MTTQTDQQLLRDYTECRSEAAFGELVRGHVDLVYSAALRMVRDAHQAEDVTQGVFVALAQNARQLADRPVLSGWLHRTAQNLAANVVRSDVRRRAREQEAVAMNELLSSEPDTDWEQIAPHLDAALGELSEADRDALFLRYFERKSAHEMAQTLGVSHEAAQKRVSRAVERLREFFAKRGDTIGASGLVVAISANAIQAAPVGLAVTISTAAALTGTTIATAATATAANVIAMTTMQKTLLAALAVAVGAGVYQTHQVSSLRSEAQTAAELAQQVQLLTSERDDMMSKLAAMPDNNELFSLRSDRAELMRLRAEVTRLRGERADLERRWRQETNGMRVNTDPKPAFEHRFLSRSTWTNAGLATPMQALENFLWAWTSRNEAAMSQVSLSDSNGLPLGLTGMSVNYQDKLIGAQVLAIRLSNTNHDVATVSLVTEHLARIDSPNGPYNGTNHGVLTLRFEKSNGEWRFAGRERRF